VVTYSLPHGIFARNGTLITVSAVLGSAIVQTIVFISKLFIDSACVRPVLYLLVAHHTLALSLKVCRGEVSQFDIFLYLFGIPVLSPLSHNINVDSFIIELLKLVALKVQGVPFVLVLCLRRTLHL
jgi:hypothetical protein